MFKIISSNRTEKLLDVLKETIYSEGSPFDRRWVAISSPVMKSWLQQEMAGDPHLQIAMGIEMGYLSQLLRHVCPAGWHLPDALEMAFALEEIIREKGEEIPEVSHFLHHPQREKRIVRLADKLAHLFVDYGIYGRSLIEKKQLEWQGKLWDELFSRHPEWKAPFQVVEEMETPSRSGTFHIFGLNFLPPLYVELLHRLSEHHAVYLYLLSPSWGFWGDNGSDREMVWLHRQWEKKGMHEEELMQWEEELNERNGLLANWGALRRRLDRLLDDPPMTHPSLPEAVATHPAYASQLEEDILFEPSPYPLTVLQAIQADMALLRPLHEKLPLEDDSVVIYAAASRRREVQRIYDHLLFLIEKEQIAPQDIVIMAPDITPYVPHIETLFEGIETQVYDLQLTDGSPSLLAFHHLLALASSRWDVVTLLDLFETPAFQRKQRWNAHDLAFIREWIEKLHIAWGEDEKHRKEILEEETTSKNSWEEGWSRLLAALATEKGVAWTEAPRLETWMEVFRSLREDLAVLHPAQKMTLREWKLWLQCLNAAYFLHDDEDQALEEVWSRWPVDPTEQIFSWISIDYHLKNLFKQSSFIRRENHLHAVRVCSMLPMRAIPAQVVVLMGMDKEVFPHGAEKGGLNQLKKQAAQVDYPTEKEFDCFLMMEALLSARRQLVLSYSSDHPSSLLQELIEYLEKAFQKKEWITKVPFRPYDPSLFQSPSLTYSSRYFEEAKALQKGSSFHSFLQFDADVELVEEPFLDIKDLLIAAKNPLKLYFQKTLHLSLQEQEEELSADESFFLDPLVLYQAKIDSLEKPVDEIIASLQIQGALPSGLLGSHAERKIRQEAVKEPLEVYSITWKEGIETATLIEKKWLLPPLKVGEVILTGTLEGVTSQGLISWKEESIQEWWALWPRALLLMTLPEECSIEKKILFLKEEKEVEIALTKSREWLGAYIHYTRYVSCHPVLTLPKWIEKIMKKDVSLFEEEYIDDYTKWVLSRQQIHPASLPWEKWQQLIVKTVDMSHSAFRRME